MDEIEYTGSLDMLSPNNSSDSNLRKKWKIMNNKRCLMKILYLHFISTLY